MAVAFEADGGVGAIVLDRPPANSYDLAMMREFGAAVDAAIESGLKVVVLRSASAKFFSAGADVKAFLEGEVESNMEMIHTSQAAFKRMEAAPTVFIAQIEGHALGGGLEITLACDLRFAADRDYKLGTPEVTLGLLPGNGGTQRLTRMVGSSMAMDLLISGRTIAPAEALSIGLVNGIADGEGVRAHAERYAAGPGLALAAIKRCVRIGGGLSLEEGLALEAEEVEKLFRSEDADEGLNAFAEKRRPEFAR
jgi:enoyl-CoA hydratase/carnithine racemase